MTHDDLQSSNLPDALVGDPRLENPDGTFRDKADHIQQIGDYGFDLGGPILKDKLWFYGSWGKQDVRLTRLNGTPDKTLLTSYNAKVNWQATGDTMVSAFFFDGKKEKFGRSPGSGLNEPAEFLWNQSNAYEEDRPHGLWKLEVPDFLARLLHVPWSPCNNGSASSVATPGSYVRLRRARPSPLRLLPSPAPEGHQPRRQRFRQGLGGNHELSSASATAT
jgi:hypothetical protein